MTQEQPSFNSLGSVVSLQSLLWLLHQNPDRNSLSNSSKNFLKKRCIHVSRFLKLISSFYCSHFTLGIGFHMKLISSFHRVNHKRYWVSTTTIRACLKPAVHLMSSPKSGSVKTLLATLLVGASSSSSRSIQSATSCRWSLIHLFILQRHRAIVKFPLRT